MTFRFNVNKAFTKPAAFSTWHILLFVILLLAMLFLLFPQKLLMKSLADNSVPSPLALAYLRNVITLHPGDHTLEISLAEQELQAGHLQKAAAIIFPYLTPNPESADQWKALSIHYQILSQSIQHLPSQDPLHNLIKAEMRSILTILANSIYLKADQAAMLAEDAVAMDLPRIAVTFYKKSLQLKVNKPPSYYASAGKVALFISDYSASAEFYLQAMTRALSIPAKRLFFTQAVNSLVMSNNPKKALDFALKHIDGLTQDKDTQVYMAKLARMADHLQLAEIYIAQVLQLKFFAKNQLSVIDDPNIIRSNFITSRLPQMQQAQLIRLDEAIYDLGYKIYLENNQSDLSFIIAFAAVEQKPDSIIWRKRLMQTALWNQQPIIALEQNLYLARRYQDSQAITVGKRLAISMHEDFALSEFILADIKNGNNYEANWKKYIEVMVRLGEPQAALHNLTAYKSLLPLDFYYAQAAHLYWIMNDAKQEETALLNYSNEKGMQPFVAKELTEIYLGNGNISRAFEVLSTASQFARNEDSNFWDLYGNIAWLFNRNQEALIAYEKLILQGKANEEEYERVIELYSNLDLLLAYRYAQEGKTKFPHDLSLAKTAFSLALETGHWEDFNALLSTTPAPLIQELNHDPDFWKLKTAYWQHNGSYTQVLQLFKNAIALFPTDNSLKANYLYFLIHSNNIDELRKTIAQWNNQQAINNSEFNDAVEAANDLLNNDNFEEKELYESASAI